MRFLDEAMTEYRRYTRGGSIVPEAAELAPWKRAAATSGSRTLGAIRQRQATLSGRSVR